MLVTEKKHAPEPIIRRSTEPSLPCYSQDGWSSEDYSDEEEDAFEAFNGISHVVRFWYLHKILIFHFFYSLLALKIMLFSIVCLALLEFLNCIHLNGCLGPSTIFPY